MPDDLGPALMMRLLTELPCDVPSYFRHLTYQLPMASALWHTVRELRMAALLPDQLVEKAFQNQAAIAGRASR